MNMIIIKLSLLKSFLLQMIFQSKIWIIITCLLLLFEQKTTLKQKKIDIKRLLSENQTDSSYQIKKIKQIEIQQKRKMSLKKQITYQYSFELHKMDQLHFDIIEKQQVKGTVQIAWKQYKKKQKKHIFVLPQVLESQKVFMQIYQNSRIILQKQFYTGTAFKFDAQQTKNYSFKIFGKQKAIFQKMAQIHIQQRRVQTIQNCFNMTNLQKIEFSLSQMLHQTKMLINSAQNRYLFQKNTIKMTLHQIYQDILFTNKSNVFQFLLSILFRYFIHTDCQGQNLSYELQEF